MLKIIAFCKDNKFSLLTMAALAVSVLVFGHGVALAVPFVGAGMIMDARNEFCDATSCAAAAGTALLGNVIDLGTTTRDIGNGEPLYLMVTVDTEIITGGNAGTIQFFLASDAQAAIATDGSATIHASSASLVTDGTDANDALCKAGATILCVALPQGKTYERYLGILCTVATTTVTAGKINAFLTKDPRGNRAYPDAI